MTWDDKMQTYMWTGLRHSNVIETKSQNTAIVQHTNDIYQKRKIRPLKLELTQEANFFQYQDT